MGPRATIAEDGAKFLGILSWAAYFALTSVDIARSVLQETHTKRGDAPADLHADAVAGDQRLVQAYARR